MLPLPADGSRPELLDAADEVQRSDLLVALGEAQARAGDTLKAQRTFRVVADMAKRLNDAQRLARAALWYGGVGITAGGVDKTLVALLEDALRMLPKADGALRARALARLLGWPESEDLFAAALLQDMAILLGAKVISDELGMTLEKATLDDLGQTQRQFTLSAVPSHAARRFS